MPQVDRVPEEAPPTVVAIVGPPGVSHDIYALSSGIGSLTVDLFMHI